MLMLEGFFVARMISVIVSNVTPEELEETVTPERTVHAMDKVHVVAETSEPLAAKTSNKTVGDAGVCVCVCVDMYSCHLHHNVHVVCYSNAQCQVLVMHVM